MIVRALTGSQGADVEGVASGCPRLMGPRSKRLRCLALAAPLLLLVACTATPVSTPTPPAASATTPSAPVASARPSAPVASPTPNRPAHAGAPPIADPYWLLYDGTSTSSVTDKDKNLIQSDRSENYQVIDGGSLEGTILVNGEVVGWFEVTVTEGEAIPGLDPIEQQYGAQIDDIQPASEVPGREPNPFWTRTTQHRAGLDVFVRVPSQPDVDVDLASEAFWWGAGHEQWYRLSVMPASDLESVLGAVLGAKRG